MKTKDGIKEDSNSARWTAMLRRYLDSLGSGAAR
jgi:hypothetical protein